MNSDKIYDQIIVGAGAAGLFCASLCHGQTLVLEQGGLAGRKIRVSGGGRANFSNTEITPKYYNCETNPEFCASALKVFNTSAIITQIKKWGLPFTEKDHGRLFLKCPATRLVESLINSAVNARIEFASRVTSICTGNMFTINTADNSYKSRRLVLALGSPARPRLAGCVNCWQLAGALGHKVYPPIPALAPLHYVADHGQFRQLAGISLPVRISLQNRSYLGQRLVWNDDILFTHHGISGPIVLQASLFWEKNSELLIDFLPAESFEKLLDKREHAAGTPLSLLRRKLPDRLAESLLPPQWAKIKNASLSRAVRHALGNGINNFRFSGLKLCGMNKAEVARGGINTREITPESMQSKIIPGLYIIGEMLNVTGALGGYNLHWAFASAFCASANLNCS